MSAKIFSQIIAIMKDVDAIGKDRTNSGQGYKFRGIDDIYNVMHPLLAKHGVFTATEVLEDRTEERVSGSNRALIYRILKISFKFYADDGSFFEVVTIGEGMDSGDKASNKAMSVAHKYALLQTFAIPTEDNKDPEYDSHEVLPKNNPPMKTIAQAVHEAKADIKKGNIDQAILAINECKTTEDLEKVEKKLKERTWTKTEEIQLQGLMMVRRKS